MQGKYRKEVKYIIPVKEFYHLKNKLEHHIQPDKFSGDKGYEVRSLYFDSYNDRDLLDVLDGLLLKSKIRLRIYSKDASSVKLEYKCKNGTDGVKMALDISREEAYSMIKGDYSFLLTKGEALAAKLFVRLKTGGYFPKVIVNYNRLAYIYAPNDIRITFDSNIKSSLITSSFFDQDAACKPVIEPDKGVLEVKYTGFLFGYLKKVLESIDALPVSSSKYANSRISWHS